MWPVCESTVHLQMCLEIKNRAEVMEPGGFGVEGAFPEYVSGLACWPIGKPYCMRITAAGRDMPSCRPRLKGRHFDNRRRTHQNQTYPLIFEKGG